MSIITCAFLCEKVGSVDDRSQSGRMQFVAVRSDVTDGCLLVEDVVRVHVQVPGYHERALSVGHQERLVGYTLGNKKCYNNLQFCLKYMLFTLFS